MPHNGQTHRHPTLIHNQSSPVRDPSKSAAQRAQGHLKSTASLRMSASASHNLYRTIPTPRLGIPTTPPSDLFWHPLIMRDPTSDNSANADYLASLTHYSPTGKTPETTTSGTCDSSGLSGDTCRIAPLTLPGETCDSSALTCDTTRGGCQPPARSAPQPMRHRSC